MSGRSGASVVSESSLKSAEPLATEELGLVLQLWSRDSELLQREYSGCMETFCAPSCNVLAVQTYAEYAEYIL